MKELQGKIEQLQLEILNLEKNKQTLSEIVLKMSVQVEDFLKEKTAIMDKFHIERLAAEEAVNNLASVKQGILDEKQTIKDERAKIDILNNNLIAFNEALQQKELKINQAQKDIKASYEEIFNKKNELSAIEQDLLNKEKEFNDRLNELKKKEEDNIAKWSFLQELKTKIDAERKAFEQDCDVKSKELEAKQKDIDILNEEYVVNIAKFKTDKDSFEISRHNVEEDLRARELDCIEREKWIKKTELSLKRHNENIILEESRRNK